MITLRKRILLIIGSILLVTILILLFVFFRKKEAPSVTENPVIEQPVAELPPIENVEYRRPETLPQQEVFPPSTPDEVYAKQTARIFVERFWSYSNQNDNQHITDALALATESMRAWITSQSQEQSALYQGVTTEVLSTRIVSYTPEKTTVEIGARQTVRTSGGESGSTQEVSTITARVDLVKVGTSWMVEGLWKE